MNDRRLTLIDTFFGVAPALLAFLMPIFFLPITSEFFEFNKLALLTVFTVVMLVMWAVKMLLIKKVEVAKSLLDLPILLLVLIVVLSSVFSLNKPASIFGSQGRWFPSLFGMATIVLFYYITSSNSHSKSTVKNTLYAFIAGSTVSSVVALLSYFGISLGEAGYLRITNFTLTGSSIIASTIAALSSVFSIVMLINTRVAPAKVLLIQAIIVNFLAVALIGGLPSWAVLIIGLLVFAFFAPAEKLTQNRNYLLATVGVVFAVILVLIIPTTRGFIINSNYPRELTLAPRESWIVVSSTVRDFPILGTGPSTFHLNYPRYKPLTVNTKDYWNVRFDKPFSEVFSIIGSYGILGVIATLLFVYKVARFGILLKQHQDDEGLITSLSVGIISLLALFIFTYSTVLTMFLFFLFLAMGVSILSRDERTKEAEYIQMSLSSITVSGMSLAGGASQAKETFQYIAVVVLVGSASALVFFSYRTYAAEYYMRSSIKAAQQNDGSLTYQMQQRAINTNPGRSTYHSAYASTNLALANTLAGQPDLTDDQRTTIQTLIAQAIRSARVATEVASPLNVNNWEVRANLYRALIGIAADADTWAVGAYNTAIQLDPTNPRLRLDLGGVYYTTGDYLSAANLFNQAVTLKGDYANAHYNLAQSLIMLEQYADARRELITVRNLVPADSSDYERVVAEIEALEEAQPEATGTSTQPTVGELETTGSEPTQVEQEPLTNVGEEEVIEGGTNLELEEIGEIEPETTPQEPAEEAPEEEITP